jgi:peptidoglycan-N-acetylglucosamine deacetylase
MVACKNHGELPAMHHFLRSFSLAAALGLFTGLPAAADDDCQAPDGGLGVSRIIEIDTRNGPLFGAISKHTKEPEMLRPKEIVLTFDDGPLPKVTRSILKTLDAFCTKATFFPVGKMAVAYPRDIQEIQSRGHTVGGHTWSHPLNLRRYSLDKAVDQIERGFSAVALAANKPIAPFFRFPGLNDSDPMLKHLQKRGIATFTVDVVSNDSYIASSSRLANYTIGKVAGRKRGIMLFHDIKPATARALPAILRYLKRNGYKVVHLTAKDALKVKRDFDADLEPRLAKVLGKSYPGKDTQTDTHVSRTLVASAEETDDGSIAAAPAIPITKIAPPLRKRAATAKRAHAATAKSGLHNKRRYQKPRSRVRKSKRRKYRYRRPPPPPPSPFWF